MKFVSVLMCCLLLGSCVVQRDVVRQPELSLQVTGKDAPLANLKVYLYWLSNPYSRLEQTQTFMTDLEGKVRLEQVLQSDTAYPLALHGVSEYEHKLCVEAEGYRTLLVTLVALPGDTIRLDLPLTAGDTFKVCGSYDTLSYHSGVPRPDVAAQHESVRGAYEITAQ
jgi:hypothetical protein